MKTAYLVSIHSPFPPPPSSCQPLTDFSRIVEGNWKLKTFIFLSYSIRTGPKNKSEVNPTVWPTISVFFLPFFLCRPNLSAKHFGMCFHSVFFFFLIACTHMYSHIFDSFPYCLWIWDCSMHISLQLSLYRGFPGGSDSKESASNVGDLTSIPGFGRSPGRRHGNPLRFSCLKHAHGQRSLAAVHGVTKSQTQLSDWAQQHIYIMNISPVCCEQL